jgi:uncharacterized protein
MKNLSREAQVRQWSMLLHFSLLAGLVVPYAGMIAPIIIWMLKKEELPEINPHGKIVVNWVISVFIYGMVLFTIAYLFIILMAFFFTNKLNVNIDNGSIDLLSFSSFGIVWFLVFILITAFGLFNIIFPIIGGVKASNGEAWQYPLSLRIIK